MIVGKGQITISAINDGEPGPIGKRVISGLVYYQLSSSTAPAVPAATAFDFANNSFTGLTENWALTPPVFEAGNANKFWYAGFYVEESASGSGTGVPAFSTVKQAISFSGLVTFTGDNTVTDGQKTLSFGENGTTEINGDNIKTGKVSAARIDVESLAVLEAFINLLRVKNARTDADGIGAYLEIQSPTEEDQVARLKLRGGNAAGYDTFVDIYAEDNSADPEITEPDAVLSVKTNTASSSKYAKVKSHELLMYSVTGLSSPATARYYRAYYSNTGIIIQSKIGSAEYAEYVHITWDATDGLIFKLPTIQTTNPGANQVWKNPDGLLRIGDEVLSVGVSEVSTLVSTPITYSSVNASVATTAQGTISFANNIPTGKNIMLHIEATASLTVSFAAASGITFCYMDESSWALTSGEVLEISVWCYSAGKYSISSKKMV